MTHKTEIKLRVDLNNSVIFCWHPQWNTLSGFGNMWLLTDSQDLFFYPMLTGYFVSSSKAIIKFKNFNGFPRIFWLANQRKWKEVRNCECENNDLSRKSKSPTQFFTIPPGVLHCTIRALHNSTAIVHHHLAKCDVRVLSPFLCPSSFQSCAPSPCHHYSAVT